MSDKEIKQRLCRCCNRKFDYPVLKSRATRFHCEACAELRPELRKVFETMNRRLKQHELDIARLKQQCFGGS